MRTATLIGSVLLAGCVVVLGSVLAGAAGPVTLVALAPLGIGATVALLIRRWLARQDRQAERVRELPTRGVRRRGRVVDAVPHASPHGGPVIHLGGVLVLLRVELRAEGELPQRSVSVLVTEPTEAARARIRTDVVVLEHPEDPDIRALDGWLPNGVRGGGRGLP